MINLLAKNIIGYRDESYEKIYYLLYGNVEKYWQTDLRGIRSWHGHQGRAAVRALESSARVPRACFEL